MPRGREFALAEIISLIPIILILNIAKNAIYLSPKFRAYSQVAIEPLFGWLVILIVFYFQEFINKITGGGWGSGNDGWRSNRDYSSRDRDSFGGGRSGGGGSSKKF